MSDGLKVTAITHRGTIVPAGLTLDASYSGEDADLDAAPLESGGLAWKAPVRVATTASITIATALNAGDSLDGVTLAAGDRVLVKDQASPEDNGIWVVDAAPYRADDMDEDDEVLGAVVYVIDGTAAGQIWAVTNVTEPTIDTDAIDWAQASGGAGGGDTSGQLVGGFDGGGLPVDAGKIYFGVVPYSGTITGWRILARSSGNAAFDVAVCAAGAIPAFPGDSIVAAAPPSMTGDTEVSGSTLTGWTTAITAGDNYAVKVTSATVDWTSLTLFYSRP
jgi:hypothetical protein